MLLEVTERPGGVEDRGVFGEEEENAEARQEGNNTGLQVCMCLHTVDISQYEELLFTGSKMQASQWKWPIH